MRKLFETHEVRRTPTRVTPAAQEFLISSSQEGRILEQALSEAFGNVGNVAYLTIDIGQKQDYFPTHEEPEGLLLVIVAHHQYTSDSSSYRWLVNATDVMERHPITGVTLFQSRHLAAELVRSYPYK